MPIISVLMPVFNGCTRGVPEYLCTAIESILNQTFEDFEFIIVNDGSTDDTQLVLEKYANQDSRIKIFKQFRNGGVVSALNAGLQQCSGQYIARQDADDYSTVTRLEIQRNFLDNRPNTALCGTGMYVVNEEGKLVMEVKDRPCNYNSIKEFLKQGCPFVHGSVMFRKNVIEELGGYSPEEKFKHAEDYELWVRFAKKYSVENIPDTILYFHRNHKAKVSNQFAARQGMATATIRGIAQQCL